MKPGECFKKLDVCSLQEDQEEHLVLTDQLV